MAKYDPLRRYLSRQTTPSVTLSFAEIERMIGALLPKGAARMMWWADTGDDDPKAVQKAAWRDIGYTATLLPGEDRARFDRAPAP